MLDYLHKRVAIFSMSSKDKRGMFISKCMHVLSYAFEVGPSHMASMYSDLRLSFAFTRFTSAFGECIYAW